MIKILRVALVLVAILGSLVLSDILSGTLPCSQVFYYDAVQR